MSLEFWLGVAEKEGIDGEAVSTAGQAHQAVPISAHNDVSNRKHRSIHRSLNLLYFERLDCLMFIFYFISKNLAKVLFGAVERDAIPPHKVTFEGGVS
jgi:hypothetical protein